MFVDNGLYSWSAQLICDKDVRLFEFEGWALTIHGLEIDAVESIW